MKRIIQSERENGHGGFIVRTAAMNAAEEDLRADIRFARINPARARDFARASGQLAKTDAIDAAMADVAAADGTPRHDPRLLAGMYAQIFQGGE